MESLGQSCTAPAAVFHAGKPQPKLPVTLKTKKKLTVVFDVSIDCANDPLKTSGKSPGHEDYALRATVDHNALGSSDAHSAADVCPRDVTAPGTLDPFPDGKLLECGREPASALTRHWSDPRRGARARD